jgi:ribosome-binding protein aMBF1 (putative translation factor)
MARRKTYDERFQGEMTGILNREEAREQRAVESAAEQAAKEQKQREEYERISLALIDQTRRDQERQQERQREEQRRLLGDIVKPSPAAEVEPSEQPPQPPRDWIDIIRERFAAEGWTAYSLALASGVDASQITRFLKGERDLRLGTAQRLCRALGLDLVSVGEASGTDLTDEREKG